MCKYACIEPLFISCAIHFYHYFIRLLQYLFKYIYYFGPFIYIVDTVFLLFSHIQHLTINNCQ